MSPVLNLSNSRGQIRGNVAERYQDYYWPGQVIYEESLRELRLFSLKERKQKIFNSSLQLLERDGGKKNIVTQGGYGNQSLNIF